MQRHKYFLSIYKYIVLLIIIFGCTSYYPANEIEPPDTDEIKRILEEAVNTSFKIEIELSRSDIITFIYGEYDKRGRIRLRYKWQIDGDKIEKDCLILDKQTLVKEDGEWKETQDSERLPHELVFTVISFGDFIYTGKKKGNFTYEFTPNLLFLSPFIENGEAQINLDSQTFQPLDIIAKGNGVYFNARFSCFGEEIKIEHPFSKVYHTQISPIPNDRDLSIIKMRIITIGADDCWFKNDRLYIKIPYTDEGIIKRLLKRGIIHIHTASYPEETLEIVEEKYGDRLVFLDLNPILIDSILYEGTAEDVFYTSGIKDKEILIRFIDNIISLIPILVMIDNKGVCLYQKFLGRDMEIDGDIVDYSILKFGSLSRDYQLIED